MIYSGDRGHELVKVHAVIYQPLLAIMSHTQKKLFIASPASRGPFYQTATFKEKWLQVCFDHLQYLSVFKYFRV